MFDNKQIESFRQIKAPAELRTKVLGANPIRRQTPVMRYAAMAACTVFLVTAVLLLFPMGSGIAVTTGGNAVTSDGIALAVQTGNETAAYSLARTAPAADSLEVPLEFEVDSTCSVTVSAGDLTMDGQSLQPGTEIEADGRLNLIWHINPADRDNVYSLVLHTDGEKTVLVMKYDTGWMIRLGEN
jgi:hypothetical protein